MQDTSILGTESHPLHLYGLNFFVVGEGFGNFNPKNDPKNFNLVDPVERNTVGVCAFWWLGGNSISCRQSRFLIIFNIAHIFLFHAVI